MRRVSALTSRAPTTMRVPVRASAAAVDTRKIGREDGQGRVAGDDEVEDAAGAVADEGDVLASELGSEMLVDSGSGLTVTDRTEVTESVLASKPLDAKVVVAIEEAESVVVSGMEVSAKLIESGSSAPDC